ETAHPEQPHGHAHPQPLAARGPRRRGPPEGLARRPGQAALRLLAQVGRGAAGAEEDRGHVQRIHPAELQGVRQGRGTGDGAADDVSRWLDGLEATPCGPEKEADAKAAQVELSQLVAPVLTKEDLRTRVVKMQKGVVDELKKRQKAEAKTALNTTTGYFAGE